MKTVLIALSFFALFMTAAQADPAEGLWRTEPGDDGSYALVRISTCGPFMCGVIDRAVATSGDTIDDPFDGRLMIWDMQAQPGGTYTNGRIWAADRDKTYASRMALAGNNLTVQGCILGICRGQTWLRQ